MQAQQNLLLQVQQEICVALWWRPGLEDVLSLWFSGPAFLPQLQVHASTAHQVKQAGSAVELPS